MHQLQEFGQQRHPHDHALEVLEAELAGVMAHEIAHVAARHSTRQQSRATVAQILTIPLMVWGGWGGYDRYFAQALNNAHLGAVAAYNDLVPAFEAVLHAEGDDLSRFYRRVKKLADEDKAQRTRELDEAALQR